MPSKHAKQDQAEQDQAEQDQAVAEAPEEALAEPGEAPGGDDETLEEAEAHIEDEIEQARKQAEENWELLLRTKAEMENLRRRTHKDLENAHKFAIEKFVSELLPIKDSMELGLTIEEASTEALKEGMELTLSMLNSTFDKFSLVEINPINEKFDHERHQAMSMQPTDEVEPNTVIAVVQKGYALNERLIRPAMVMVSKAAEEESE